MSNKNLLNRNKDSVIAQSKIWYLIFILIPYLSSFHSAQAQHTVVLTTSSQSASDCGVRTVTATVSGGSGNFSYYWQSTPPARAKLGSGPTIEVDPIEVSTIGVGVFDATTGAFVHGEIVVYPKVSGDFAIAPPANIFTPNKDGYNDVWKVLSPNNGTAPIHANAYNLSIRNRYGTEIYRSNGQDNRVGSGYNGGEIQWNGSGAPSNGVYYWYLTLYNCGKDGNYSGFSQQFNGTVQINGPIVLNAISPLDSPFDESTQSSAIYPNPVSDQLIIQPSKVLHNNNAVGLASTESSTSSPNILSYEVKLVDKSGQVKRSVNSSASEIKIDVSNLPEGTYFLQFKQGKNIKREQIVVNH